MPIMVKKHPIPSSLWSVTKQASLTLMTTELIVVHYGQIQLLKQIYYLQNHQNVFDNTYKADGILLGILFLMLGIFLHTNLQVCNNF